MVFSNKNYQLVNFEDYVFFQEGPGIRSYEYSDRGCKMINVKCIKDGYLDLCDTKFVSWGKINKDWKHFLVDEGDILVTTSGTIGRVARVAKSDLPILMNTSVIRFRPFNEGKLDSGYLKFFLMSKFFFYQLESQSTKMCIKNVGPTHIKKIKLILPDIKEQKRIVEILEKADALCKKLQEAEELNSKIIQSIFLEMFGNVQNNFKGINKQKISEVTGKCERRDPTRKPSVNFKYVDISGLNGDKGVIETYKEIKGKDAPSRARQVIHANDVVISTVRPNLRATALAPLFLDNQICSTGFCVLRPTEQINHYYLYTMTRLEWFTGILVSKVRGASYPAVTDKDILEIEIPVPSMPEQKKFADLVQKVDKIKEKQQESKKELDDLFNSLMQKIF